MSKRTARTSAPPEAAALIRAAFEPRYGHALADDAVDGIADRFRRFAEVLVSFEQEDRARAALAAQAPQPAVPPSSPPPPPRRTPPSPPPSRSPGSANA